MSSPDYIPRVLEHLRRLLAERESELPCAFLISGAWIAHPNSPLAIRLDPHPPHDGALPTGGVFAEVQRRLNDAFRADPSFRGIELRLPHRFLNPSPTDPPETMHPYSSRTQQ